MSNGKGDKPRNCFSKKFRDNFDDINWRDYYYVFEGGRPLGLFNHVFAGSAKEADKQLKLYNDNSPCGASLHEFKSAKEAIDFIRSHVQNKELNQVIIPVSRFQKGRT